MTCMSGGQEWPTAGGREAQGKKGQEGRDIEEGKNGVKTLEGVEVLCLSFASVYI